MKKLFLLVAVMTMSCTAFAQIPTTGKGDGLNGEYWSGSSNFDKPIPDLYKNTDFHTSPSQDEGGTKQFTRVDSVVHFEWGSGNPFNNTYDDMSYSIKWTGWLLAPVTADYTFDLTYCDDAFSLKMWDVNDMDTPVAEYDKEYIGGSNFGWNWDKSFWLVPASLEKDHYYYVELKYFENAGGAHINFRWMADEYSVASETIPQAQLYSKNPTIATGINNIDKVKVGIKAVPSGIEVNCTKGLIVNVFSAAGAKVASANVNGTKLFELPAGMYLVNTEGTSKKVMVK